MELDQLTIHLDNLQRDDCYRVDKVLKESSHEITQIVYFVGKNNAEQGPYIRKYLSSSLGLGSAYEIISAAWRSGKRFKHIPLVFDCCQMGESMVVIMEYVAGETLHDVVHREGPSVSLAASVFPAICDALIELHESFSAPIIHRDLKPSNIMLTRHGLTLIDFGISRLYNESAEVDTYHFGTRHYAPPEQFGFGQTDVRSDVYSLGMVLYYCLTEQIPTAKIRDKGFQDSRIPVRLREVLINATALDPKQRYSTVHNMKNAFLKALSRVHPSSFLLQPPQEQYTAKTRELASQRDLRKQGLLSKIPRSLGIVWNCLVLLVFFLFALVCFLLTIDPGMDYEHVALYKRAFLFGSIALLFFGPIAFFLLDKRMFERFLPALAHLSLLKQFIISLIAFTIGCAAICAFIIVWF